MKKFISIILAITMIFSLSACGHITVNIEKDSSNLSTAVSSQPATITTPSLPQYVQLNKPSNFNNFKCTYGAGNLWNADAQSIISYHMEYICDWYETLAAKAMTQSTLSAQTVIWDSSHLTNATDVLNLYNEYSSVLTWVVPLRTLISDYLVFMGGTAKESYRVSELDIDSMGNAIQSAIYSYYRIA